MINERQKNDPHGASRILQSQRKALPTVSPKGRSSGIVIDTPASFALATPYGPAGEGKYPLVRLAVDALDGTLKPDWPMGDLPHRKLSANIIVVIGNEKLHVEMQRLFGSYGSSTSGINVVKLPKSGGV